MQARLAAFLVAALAVAGAPAVAGPVVIELFTSQACPKCPPADALLGELSAREDVIALTFPVAYWDTAAWSDTLARPENAVRQRAYAAVLGHRRVYTPEMIVDGARDVKGYERAEIERAMQAAHEAHDDVALSVVCDAGRVSARVTGAADGRPAIVRLATVEADPVRVAVRGGANAGRDNVYHAVVRDLADIGRWSGGSAEFAAALPTPDPYAHVVLVQEAPVGRILAARRCLAGA